LSPAVRAGIGRAIVEAQEGVAAFNEKRAPDFSSHRAGVSS
jgi:1,4-dihydroxy-2-naphthoyl-CoA synthase